MTASLEVKGEKGERISQTQDEGLKRPRGTNAILPGGSFQAVGVVVIVIVVAAGGNAELPAKPKRGGEVWSVRRFGMKGGAWREQEVRTKTCRTGCART